MYYMYLDFLNAFLWTSEYSTFPWKSDGPSVITTHTKHEPGNVSKITLYNGEFFFRVHFRRYLWQCAKKKSLLQIIKYIWYSSHGCNLCYENQHPMIPKGRVESLRCCLNTAAQGICKIYILCTLFWYASCWSHIVWILLK